jgi:DNA uptake protein ComE-like DNA-binding protein
MHRRKQARELAEHNPVLARDLKIGRPDRPHDYDDGGLVDVNQVPGDVLTSCLGLKPAESAAVIAARDQLGRFSSPDELSAYAQLPPARVDELRDWMMFG